MTFGWEGFSFEHPEEWAPLALSGNREQGYARVASPGRQMIQVRWRRLKKAADANVFLDAYLGRLEKDTRRARQAFSSSRGLEGERVSYRYTGLASGRGVVFPTCDGRTFVLESVATQGNPTLSVLNTAVGTFQVCEDRDRWSAFGLDLSLPSGMRVEKKQFQAGRTALELGARGVQVRAERWGLADRLLAQHELVGWAQALLRMTGASVVEESSGFRLCVSGRWRSASAIVMHQVDRNQIVVVQSTSREERWRPSWDWLN